MMPYLICQIYNIFICVAGALHIQLCHLTATWRQTLRISVVKDLFVTLINQLSLLHLPPCYQRL